MFQDQLSLMGVLNVTPDSFYDGGRHHSKEKAFSHALQMIQEGADIIDIGGESTRPGAQIVSPEEECDRVIPVIEKLKQETDTPISIDSRHTAVIKAALDAGAVFVNDVYALQDDGALATVAAANVPVCLMHMQGTPESMQNRPHYQDVLQELYHFFIERIVACEQAGIAREKIWLDPGFGFGKTLDHNLTLLTNLSFFKTLGCPLLIGLSRKSMFGEILNKPADERLHGTLAATMVAALQDVSIIRTHDVAATKDILTVARAIKPYLQRREQADVCTA